MSHATGGGLPKNARHFEGAGLARGMLAQGQLFRRPIMKRTHALLLSIPLAAVVLAVPRDAAACGGCFVPMEESTQVTGHRMMLSISQQETTLWDQIEYSGNPQSFGWVLPTKGIVEVGLSSD